MQLILIPCADLKQQLQAVLLEKSDLVAQLEEGNLHAHAHAHAHALMLNLIIYC